MKLSVIIVNYNTGDKIGECLNSLESDLSEIESEIIVVDNASIDDSVKIVSQLAEKSKKLKIIKNQKNLGFAVANNVGAKQAEGDFLFFLNPDTRIIKDTISNLLEFVKKNPDAIVGPKILNPNDSVQGSCFNLPTILGAFKEYWLGQEGAYEKFAPKANRPTQVEAIVGAAMFMRKEIFEKLGGFDRRYFLYYEDLDFCRKARKKGYKIYYLPQARVVHFLGISGKKMKGKTYESLQKSSKIYHGATLSFLINLIIFLGQKWQKLLNHEIQ